MDYLFAVLLSSLSSASILLIATIGLAVVFGLMGVINLAHGEFIMFGAYAALTATQQGVPFILSIPIAVLLTMIFGALVEILIIRRLYGRMFDTMLATWGLSLALYQCAVIIFGTVSPGIGMPQMSIAIGEYSLAVYPLLMIVVAASMLIGVYYLLTKSVYGMKARAAIQVPHMARAIGINSSNTNTLTFAIGCGLAGFAGAVLLPIVPATPSMGFAFVIKSFLIVVVAGPVTLAGSALSAIGMGGGASVISSFMTSVAGDIFFFALTLLLLRFYPLGISSRWRFKL
ncbi:ABC transporter permease subunit [Sneathiella chinensis]|uniref:Branched-chain amino acid ABC transporter permease n=1 Tax=Sneathiella chinensis TaxID=349750 RepID=A0ABQ5U6B7_9PROT|nr:branched-chain amino acid ABC transporter permease [Sneathiella chinensis]GLQ06768.1 branched-chain amino acid ABC transporter permease [Sneathiella chinensis]